MKCSACTKVICDGKYEQRKTCMGVNENIKCECICQLNPSDVSFKTVATIGAAATAAGVGLTIASAGLLPTIAGTALYGAGSSLIQLSVQKQLSNEPITIKDSINDAALNAATGIITLPINSIGLKVSPNVSAFTKAGINVLARVGANTAYRIGSKFIECDDVSIASLKEAMSDGLVSEIVGGILSQIANFIPNVIQDEIGQTVARIALQFAAIDVAIDLYQNKKIDTKQLILRSAGQAMTLASALIGSSLAQLTNAYNNKVNFERIENSSLSPDDKQKVMSIVNEANSLIENDELKGYKKYGIHNLHNLWGARTGQVAADINPSVEGRGPERALFDYHKDKLVYLDHTMEHNYKDLKPTIKNQIPNPLNQNLMSRLINYGALKSKL